MGCLTPNSLFGWVNFKKAMHKLTDDLHSHWSFISKAEGVRLQFWTLLVCKVKWGRTSKLR